MKKVLSAILLANMSLFAFSASSISVLYGDFDGTSGIFDVKDKDGNAGGGKTTVTFETFTKNNVGDVFGFVDYTIATESKLFGGKTGFYGEYHPRLSLGYVTGKDLSLPGVKDFFIATELNAGSGADFRAELIGLGTDMDIPGFDFFSLNVFYKHVNLTLPDSKNGFAETGFVRNTFQISPAYGTHFGDTGISFKGWMDYTEYSYQTQNQILYDVTKIGGTTLQVGFEHLYYYEIKSDDGSKTHPESNTLQAMTTLKW
jgi:nucleoside-specific outer membrane channel protein Tsx